MAFSAKYLFILRISSEQAEKRRLSSRTYPIQIVVSSGRNRFFPCFALYLKRERFLPIFSQKDTLYDFPKNPIKILIQGSLPWLLILVYFYNVPNRARTFFKNDSIIQKSYFLIIHSSINKETDTISNFSMGGRSDYYTKKDVASKRFTEARFLKFLRSNL